MDFFKFIEIIVKWFYLFRAKLLPLLSFQTVQNLCSFNNKIETMKKLVLLLSMGILNTASAQNLLTGLQACYPMDCTAQNFASTGSVLNGTAVNLTCATGHNGQPGTAYQFGGANNTYFRVPGSAQTRPMDSLTVSGWFYVDSNPATLAEQYLVYTRNNCGSNYEAFALFISFTGGNIKFNTEKHSSTGCSGLDVNQTGTVSTNTWHHVVFYMDNSISELYVNGSLAGSGIHNIPFDYLASKDVILGGSTESPFYLPFKGKMDNVRFYNRKLTAQEITSLFNSDPACNVNTPTGISQEPEKENILIYPNPAGAKLYIANLSGHSVSISDVSGKLVRHIQTVSGEGALQISLDNERGGFYFVRVFNAEGKLIKTHKLVLVNP